MTDQYDVIIRSSWCLAPRSFMMLGVPPISGG